IIVINDLSTDRTQEIVEACAKRNSKVILVNHEVNRLRDYLIIRTNFVSKKKWPYSKAFVDRFGTYLFAEDEGLLVHDTKNESL
ncbi:MAG: glycosyltransferase, partial [Nitrosotalea sp.]